MKTTILIVPILAYAMFLATVPGVWEYLQLRYQKGIHPHNIEAAVAGMKVLSDKMSEELEISTYITADEIRKFDGEALKNFYSELNRSIAIEGEFAFLRSFTYYLDIQDGMELEALKQEILIDLSEDFTTFQNGPHPETNNRLKMIKELANEEPKLQRLIVEREDAE